MRVHMRRVSTTTTTRHRSTQQQQHRTTPGPAHPRTHHTAKQRHFKFYAGTVPLLRKEVTMVQPLPNPLLEHLCSLPRLPWVCGVPRWPPKCGGEHRWRLFITAPCTFQPTT